MARDGNRGCEAKSGKVQQEMWETAVTGAADNGGKMAHAQADADAQPWDGYMHRHRHMCMHRHRHMCG